jgi:outer membrane protein assembly factor BamB
MAGLVAAAVLGGSFVLAGDWTRFRGPNGSGVSSDSDPLPVTWSEQENLKWKVDLPGPGSSSPIVVGDRVLLTCWTGYGTDRENADAQEQLRRHLLCLNRKNGELIWSKAVEPALPEDRYGGMFAQHGYASHTPASDGERVYVYFGKTGALAFDLDGNQLWQTKIGQESDRRGWGSASSPILHKNLVIVTASAESEALVALNKETGEEVWRQEARGFSGTWGTPVLVELGDGRTDLVLGVPYEIWGIDPDTGKLRWFCEAMNTDSFCSSVVAENGVIYAIEGIGGGSIALRAGGNDDVTKSHVLWTGRDNNRISTPVVHDGRLYFFSNAVANCVEAATGKRIYQARLSGGASTGGNRVAEGERPGSGPPGREGFGGGFGRGGGFGGQNYASPVIGDGKLYYVTRSGETYVIKPGGTFEQLAVNRLTSDREDFSATPAISGRDLFIRSNKRLYCISESTSN